MSSSGAPGATTGGATLSANASRAGAGGSARRAPSPERSARAGCIDGEDDARPLDGAGLAVAGGGFNKCTAPRIAALTWSLNVGVGVGASKLGKSGGSLSSDGVGFPSVFTVDPLASGAPAGLSGAIGGAPSSAAPSRVKRAINCAKHSPTHAVFGALEKPMGGKPTPCAFTSVDPTRRPAPGDPALFSWAASVRPPARGRCPAWVADPPRQSTNSPARCDLPNSTAPRRAP